MKVSTRGLTSFSRDLFGLASKEKIVGETHKVDFLFTAFSRGLREFLPELFLEPIQSHIGEHR